MEKIHSSSLNSSTRVDRSLNQPTDQHFLTNGWYILRPFGGWNSDIYQCYYPLSYLNDYFHHWVRWICIFWLYSGILILPFIRLMYTKCWICGYRKVKLTLFPCNGFYLMFLYFKKLSGRTKLIIEKVIVFVT